MLKKYYEQNTFFENYAYYDVKVKVISRIAPRLALPQSSPVFGFRGASVPSTDPVGAERVPKGTHHPIPSSCELPHDYEDYEITLDVIFMI